MITYLARRVAQALFVLVLVSIIVFALLHMLPGGPARAVLGPASTPQQVAQFKQDMGLNRPLPVQYWRWVDDALHGDFGYSYKLNQSVSSLIAERLPKTVLLASLGLATALVAGVVIGVFQAARRNSKTDHVITGVMFVGWATPGFFVAILLVLIFAVKLRIFPAQAPQGTSVGEILRQGNALVLPVLAFAISSAGLYSRYARSSVIETLLEDHVRTARAKGAPSWRIYTRHVMRNASGPIVTLVGFALPALLSGSVITEAVFNYPGLGQLFWTAAEARDYPILLAITLLVGAATVVGTLVADILYAVINPRVRLG